jgi:hypothetical protein
VMIFASYFWEQLFSLSPGERGMGLGVNQSRRSSQVMCCCGQGLRCPVLRRVPHL